MLWGLKQTAVKCDKLTISPSYSMPIAVIRTHVYLYTGFNVKGASCGDVEVLALLWSWGIVPCWLAVLIHTIRGPRLGHGSQLIVPLLKCENTDKIVIILQVMANHPIANRIVIMLQGYGQPQHC